MKRTRQIVKNKECIIVICSLFLVKRLKNIQNIHTNKVKTKYTGKNLQL